MRTNARAARLPPDFRRSLFLRLRSTARRNALQPRKARNDASGQVEVFVAMTDTQARSVESDGSRVCAAAKRISICLRKTILLAHAFLNGALAYSCGVRKAHGQSIGGMGLRRALGEETQRLAALRTSSSILSEACNVLGASDGLILTSIPHSATSFRAIAATVTLLRSPAVTRACLHRKGCGDHAL